MFFCRHIKVGIVIALEEGQDGVTPEKTAVDRKDKMSKAAVAMLMDTKRGVIMLVRCQAC
jgi:hypothetical protein